MIPNIRAYDKEAKTMSYADVEYYDDMIGYRFDHFTHGADENVVFMQFSRCKDTSGVDIYEGDRLLIESEEEPYEWKTYVKSDGLFSVEVYGRDYDWTPLQLLTAENDITNIEVIGNIHENKHELEGNRWMN